MYNTKENDPDTGTGWIPEKAVTLEHNSPGRLEDPNYGDGINCMLIQAHDKRGRLKKTEPRIRRTACARSTEMITMRYIQGLSTRTVMDTRRDKMAFRSEHVSGGLVHYGMLGG